MQINIKLLAIFALLIINFSLYIHLKEIYRLKLIENLTPTDLSDNIIDPSGNNTSNNFTSTLVYIGVIGGGLIIFSIIGYHLYKYFKKDKADSKSKISSNSSKKTSNNNISYYGRQQQKEREKKAKKESLKTQKDSNQSNQNQNQNQNQNNNNNNETEESEGLSIEKKGKSDEVKKIISDYEKIIDKNKNVQKTFFMLTSSIPILLLNEGLKDAFRDKYNCPEIPGVGKALGLNIQGNINVA